MKHAKLDDEIALLLNLIRGRLLLDHPNEKFTDAKIIKEALKAYKEEFKWKTYKTNQ